MKNSMSFYAWVIGVCCLSLHATARPLGTLFFSAEERDAVHVADGEVSASGRMIRVNGLIHVRRQPEKLLVNGVWVGEGELAGTGVVIRSAGRHQVRVTGPHASTSPSNHLLKVGQQLDMQTGYTREGAEELGKPPPLAP